MNKLGVLSNDNERNYGIDLLRVIAMFFVVLLHSLGQGGILASLNKNTFQYNWFWTLEIISYCAVDIFALISGYVSYGPKEKKTKYSNYISIWLEVVFYGVIITFLFQMFSSIPITRKDYYAAIMPVTNDLYWYFTAFTGLYVIKPFLDKGIRACNNKTMKKLLICIIAIFSVFATVSKTFKLSGGYSFIWVVILYIIGATVKKCNIGKNLSKGKLFLLIIIMYFVTYIYKMYGIERTILNIDIDKNLLITYTSPTILIASIGYVLLFAKMKFNNAFVSIIKFMAPASFAIYLLNNQVLIWNYYIKDMFITITSQPTVVITCYVIGFSMMFTLVAIFIDRIRIALFKLFKIKELSIKAENILRKTADLIVKHI